jgi:hypothetical protein
LGRLLSPAVVEQEVAVASGAGSPRQEDGEVAREEGDNGEGLGQLEDLPATRVHEYQLEVELGRCAGSERQKQNGAEEKQGCQRRKKVDRSQRD